MLGTECVVLGAAPDMPSAVVTLGDCPLAPHRLPSTEEESRSIWGGVRDRPRCLASGLVIDDLVESVRVLKGSGLNVHHRCRDGAVILDAGQLPFPVVLRETLLPGDPCLG